MRRTLLTPELTSPPSRAPSRPPSTTLERCLARTSRQFHRRSRRLMLRFYPGRRHLPHLLQHWVLGLPRIHQTRLSTLAQKVSPLPLMELPHHDIRMLRTPRPGLHLDCPKGTHFPQALAPFHIWPRHLPLPHTASPQLFPVSRPPAPWLQLVLPRHTSLTSWTWNHGLRSWYLHGAHISDPSVPSQAVPAPPPSCSISPTVPCIQAPGAQAPDLLASALSSSTSPPSPSTSSSEVSLSSPVHQVSSPRPGQGVTFHPGLTSGLKWLIMKLSSPHVLPLYTCPTPSPPLAPPHLTPFLAPFLNTRLRHSPHAGIPSPHHSALLARRRVTPSLEDRLGLSGRHPQRPRTVFHVRPLVTSSHLAPPLHHTPRARSQVIFPSLQSCLTLPHLHVPTFPLHFPRTITPSPPCQVL